MHEVRAVRQCRGFSLLEALLAIAVLFMAISIFMSMLPYAFQHNDHDAYYLQAVAAGQEYLDALRDSVENGKTPPSPPTISIDPGGSIVGNGINKTSPGNFQINGSCLQIDPLSPLRDCTVNVSWNERGATRTYTIESYATQQVP